MSEPVFHQLPAAVYVPLQAGEDEASRIGG